MNKTKGNQLSDRWVITGCAGFIGSHLTEFLLKEGAEVIGIDDLSGGLRSNLNLIKSATSSSQFARFNFVEGDVRSAELASSVLRRGDIVVHLAGLVSVPGSFDDPLRFHDVNTNGTLNFMNASIRSECKRFVFASTSAVYGAGQNRPVQELDKVEPLSPYALTKSIGEQYAYLFSKSTSLDFVSLRFFNVYGSRQSPEGAYASVIPKWISAILSGHEVVVNGDGEQSRDFVHVFDVVNAIFQSAVKDGGSGFEVFNVASGESVTLSHILKLLQRLLPDHDVKTKAAAGRMGEIKMSLADISKIVEETGFSPAMTLEQGILETVEGFSSPR
ncbi:NAD-dependent epimerase/dehydratase family protein [Verrucomicrobiales bacterium BCK34]|nr:NAD-dependent epimerase/dehydratase family protein [Verrucomicrobiales bacterium BCK34]